MKLDAKHLRYLTQEEFRTLLAIELGMRNHELVPTTLIERLADLRQEGVRKCLKMLARKKLIHHDSKVYDGYKLNYLGYDYLALHTFVKRGSCVAVGSQIGVGKESDVFLCMDSEDTEHVLKLHRLGRVSFRTIKNKRDYLKNRSSANWLYLSKLAAMKEYAFMKALYDIGYPVPKPIEHNRHCVVMGRVDGYAMYQVREMGDPYAVGMECLRLIVRLAEFGLIHGDFNEFNLLVSEEGAVTVIDFPQMVSTDHKNAEYYFNRDVECIHSYFEKKHGCKLDYYPKLSDIVKSSDLDVVVSASGFSKEKERELRKLQKEQDLKLTTVEDDDDDEDEGDVEGDAGSGEAPLDIQTLKKEMEELTKELRNPNNDSTSLAPSIKSTAASTQKTVPVPSSVESTVEKEVVTRPKFRIAKSTTETMQTKAENTVSNQPSRDAPSNNSELESDSAPQSEESTTQSMPATTVEQAKADPTQDSPENNNASEAGDDLESDSDSTGPTDGNTLESESLATLQQALKDAKDKAQTLKTNELLQQLIRLKVKRAQESKKRREKLSSATKGNSKKYKKSKTERKTTRQLLDDHF